MRLRLWVIVPLMLSLACSIFAGPAPVMRWSFAGPSKRTDTANRQDWIYGVQPLPDGSYIAVGYTELTSNPGGGDPPNTAVILRVSANGTLTDETTFIDAPNGMLGESQMFDITETTPGTYVAVGDSPNGILVARIDPGGVTWKSITPAELGSIPSGAGIEAYSVRPVGSAGGVIVGGRVHNGGKHAGALLVRLTETFTPDPGFNAGQAKVLGDEPDVLASARTVRVLGPTKFAVAGSAAGNNGESDADVYFATYDDATKLTTSNKLDKAKLVSLGFVTDPLRQSVCPSTLPNVISDREEGDTVEPLPDGKGYLVSAQVNWVVGPVCTENTALTPNYLDAEIVLIRFDDNGDPLWARRVGRSSGIDFRTPLRLHDDGVVIVGNDAHTFKDQVKVSLTKTNLSGTQTWKDTYLIDQDAGDCAFPMAVAPDGGIVIAGNNDRGKDDYFIMKIGPARDLWMQDELADSGDEPNVTTQFLWTSPEIWVRREEDFFGWPNQHVHENPKYRLPALQIPNFVYAEVRNRGVEPASGVVRFQYAKASTGLIWPTSWNGGPCCPGTTNACSGEIGSAEIKDLLPGASTIVRVPWFPPNPGEFASCGPAAENGHYCLLARLETSMASATKGMAFEEVSSVGQNTLNNNNIVWKNITVVDEPGLFLKTTEHFTLVRNVAAAPAALTLTFAPP